MKSSRKWTLSEAKSDFDRGFLVGCSIEFHDFMGRCFYTVSFDSGVELEGSGVLVDARDGKVREFKSMDSAHSSIRAVGFKTSRFLVKVEGKN
jgi:hypothetical protein